MTEMNLEQDLIALRQARGLTQGQLAKRVGGTQPTIARMESGKLNNVELKTLVRVAAFGAHVTITLETYDRAAMPTDDVAGEEQVRLKNTAAA
jgi:transcriptional regulator with XRE-family HTH domain